MPRKSWQQKLDDSKDLPKVVKISGRLAARWGDGTAAIAAPRDIDALMKQVRKGRLLIVSQLCEFIAARHRTTIGCPLTTGIFVSIAAHAADEQEKAGRKRVTPYWRTLKAKGELNPRLPGGLENLRSRLEAEGHTVIQKGKRMFVVDYSQKLATLR